MNTPRTFERWDQFVEAYLANGMNAQKTARALGLSNSKAHSLLQISYVKTELDKALKQRIALARITANGVLSEISHLAFSNQQDFVTIDDTGAAHLDMTRATREQWAAVSEVQTVTDATGVTRTKIKLHDKPRALEMLGKYHKLFVDRVEVDGLDKLAEELKAARERVEAKG